MMMIPPDRRSSPNELAGLQGGLPPPRVWPHDFVFSCPHTRPVRLDGTRNPSPSQCGASGANSAALMRVDRRPRRPFRTRCRAARPPFAPPHPVYVVCARHGGANGVSAPRHDAQMSLMSGLKASDATFEAETVSLGPISGRAKKHRVKRRHGEPWNGV